MYYCKGMILCMSHGHVLYNLLEIKLLLLLLHAINKPHSSYFPMIILSQKNSARSLTEKNVNVKSCDPMGCYMRSAKWKHHAGLSTESKLHLYHLPKTVKTENGHTEVCIAQEPDVTIVILSSWYVMMIYLWIHFDSAPHCILKSLWNGHDCVKCTQPYGLESLTCDPSTHGTYSGEYRPQQLQ